MWVLAPRGQKLYQVAARKKNFVDIIHLGLIGQFFSHVIGTTTSLKIIKGSEMVTNT